MSGEVPPDSIPNSEVKLASDENSAEVARCQNSTMPPFISKSPGRKIRAFFISQGIKNPVFVNFQIHSLDSMVKSQKFDLKRLILLQNSL